MVGMLICNHIKAPASFFTFSREKSFSSDIYIHMKDEKLNKSSCYERCVFLSSIILNLDVSDLHVSEFDSWTNELNCLKKS